jgi:imidazolonepropionase-like amidohydrolase
MALAYRAARVVDGISEEPMEVGVVVVEDGRIASVGPPPSSTPAMHSRLDVTSTSR